MGVPTEPAGPELEEEWRYYHDKNNADEVKEEWSEDDRDLAPKPEDTEASPPGSPHSLTKIAEYMTNNPGVVERLGLLMDQHRQENPEAPGWTLQQAQEGLMKLNVPLSEQDARAMFAYIDQHGNNDGLMDYKDFDGLVKVLLGDVEWGQTATNIMSSRLLGALKSFDPDKHTRVHAAVHNTIEQMSGRTSSGHVVYRSTEGAPLVYSLMSLDPASKLDLVTNLLLSVVQDCDDPTEALDSLMAQEVRQQNKQGDSLMGEPLTWQEVAINGRGIEGETVLHICALLGTNDHIKVVRYLLGKFGTEMAVEGGRRVKFVDAAYTGSLFRGEVALHIAAVKNNHRIVRMLIASKASLDKPFANGEFFKSSSLHYGGTILAFACVNSDFTLFKMLVEAGAGIDMIDESGNSLLHLCVMHKRKNQFTHLITRHKELAKFLNAPNADGFTPLLLAALTRDYEMFEQVEKACREIIWEFGNVVCYKVSLDLIDSLSAHRLGYKSLLELLVDENITECTTPLMELLINDKWEAYGRTAYNLKFIMFVLDLILLSLSIHGKIDMFWSLLSVLVVHIGESVATLGYVSVRSTQLETGLAISEFTKQFGEELLPMSYSGLVIAAYAINNVSSLDECPEFQMHLQDAYSHCFCKESSILLGVASLLGWTHLLKVMKGRDRFGGVSVVMLQQMLTNDTVKWSVLYLCTLMGFTEALWANTSRSDEKTEDYTHFSIGMFKTSLADGSLFDTLKSEPGKSDSTLIEWIALIVWVGFMFISAVVLMNMLIAMMGETYELQREKAERTYKLLRASIILESERSIMGSLLEWWYCKPLDEIRPIHHVQSPTKKLTKDGQLISVYHLVVEEGLDQKNDLEDSWKNALVQAQMPTGIKSAS